MAFTKYKLAVFVDGDFWHGRDFAERKDRLLDGNNGEFWVAKIERNMARDVEVDAKLCSMGGRVLRFWGNDIMRCAVPCVRVVADALGKDLASVDILF